MGTETAATFVCEIPDRVCRICGCHDYDACVVTEAPERAWNQPGQPCWWLEEDLCSACSDRVDPRLVWDHGGSTVDHPPPLTLREKATFTWIGLVMVVALLDLVGLLN